MLTYPFYTIPDNKRIVTEKPLTVEDLKDTDIIGYIDGTYQYKGYIIQTSRNSFAGVSVGRVVGMSLNGFWDQDSTIGGALSHTLPVAAYKFDTYQERLQWLAED